MSEGKPIDRILEAMSFLQGSLCEDHAERALSGGKRIGLLNNADLQAATVQGAGSPFGGVNVIRNDDLPAQTMIVSRDLFELLKAQGVKR